MKPSEYCGKYLKTLGIFADFSIFRNGFENIWVLDVMRIVGSVMATCLNLDDYMLMLN